MWTNFLQTVASNAPLKQRLITQTKTPKMLSETWIDHSNSSPKISFETWTNFLRIAASKNPLKHGLIT